MSTTNFEVPGWERAILIHDGGMVGRIELRAWYPRASQDSRAIGYLERRPDFAAYFDEEGNIEIVTSSSAPVVQESFRHENVLLFCAGVAVGSARLTARVTRALEAE